MDQDAAATASSTSWTWAAGEASRPLGGQHATLLVRENVSLPVHRQRLFSGTWCLRGERHVITGATMDAVHTKMQRAGVQSLVVDHGTGARVRSVPEKLQ